MNNPGRRGQGGPHARFSLTKIYTVRFRDRRAIKDDGISVCQFPVRAIRRVEGLSASSAGRRAEGNRERCWMPRPLSNRIHKQGNGGVGEQDLARCGSMNPSYEFSYLAHLFFYLRSSFQFFEYILLLNIIT